MSLQIEVKTFGELTTIELYAILQLRSAVFVVEQDCVYQDMDGKDQNALHILGFKNDTLVAYTRIFKPGDYFDYASIGRVVVRQTERAFKYGYAIMEASIKAVELRFGVTTIKISAQEHLQQFYNNLGFKKTGTSYLEDGIPHITMLKS